MCQEGELSTAIREAGTLCVPVTGMREDMRLELCVGVLATLTVCPVCACTICSLFPSPEAAVIDYGRGRSPILPLTFDCSVDDTNLSSCLKIEHNTSQCLRIAGIDCGG